MGIGSFPGVKRPWSGVNRSPSSSAEFKDRVDLYALSRLWAFMAFSGVKFTFVYFWLLGSQVKAIDIIGVAAERKVDKHWDRTVSKAISHEEILAFVREFYTYWALSLTFWQEVKRGKTAVSALGVSNASSTAFGISKHNRLCCIHFRNFVNYGKLKNGLPMIIHSLSLGGSHHYV